MRNILIVDDDKGFLDLLSIILNGKFEIHAHLLAHTAMIALTDHKFDAVLLDVSLPDFTGYYVAKKMREGGINTPLAFLTNYDGEVTKDNAKEVNAEFWFKPEIVSQPQTLADKINKLIGNEEEK